MDNEEHQGLLARFKVSCQALRIQEIQPLGKLTNRIYANHSPKDKERGERLSDHAYQLFLAAGLLLPLRKPHKEALHQEIRSLEALALSLLCVQGLKRLIPSKRPDSAKQDSFPSSHTIHAVTLATVASKFDKEQAPVWCGAAALIGVSRLLVRRHRGRDVLVGSLLGYGLARLVMLRQSKD